MAGLTESAAGVLAGNDTGTMVVAAPRPYTHLFRLDAAFISIGLAHLSVDRAAREPEALLAAQWRSGMLPHIVFGNGTGYFPGPDRWATAALSPDAPAHPRTSGICHLRCTRSPCAGWSTSGGGPTAPAPRSYSAGAGRGSIAGTSGLPHIVIRATQG